MNPVLDIVARALAAEGAAVEAAPDGALEVLAPPRIQKALDVPEFVRLGFGGACPADAVRIALESDWMERLQGLLGSRGRFATLAGSPGPMPDAPADPAALLGKRLHFTNATYRPGPVAPAWTPYLLLVFRYTAVSDEQREELLTACVNESNAADGDHLVQPLIERLRSRAPTNDLAVPADLDPALAWPAERIRAWSGRCLPGRLQERLDPFLAGMRRRMDRDLDRLHDYHSGLLRECAAKARTRKGRPTSAPPDGDAVKLKLDAIVREYGAKVADLERRYAMSVRVELVQGLRVLLPVQRFGFAILRRKGRRDFWLDWNAVSRHLDALPCEGCGAQTPARAVCDEALHVVCPACAQPCGACGKPRCRACHPARCPACGQAAAGGLDSAP